MSTYWSYLGQVVRFGVVGLVANGVGFLLYLALTHFGFITFPYPFYGLNT